MSPCSWSLILWEQLALSIFSFLVLLFMIFNFLKTCKSQEIRHGRVQSLATKSIYLFVYFSSAFWGFNVLQCIRETQAPKLCSTYTIQHSQPTSTCVIEEVKTSNTSAFVETLEGTYSGTWKLGPPKGLSKTVLNSEAVLFLRSISIRNE